MILQLYKPDHATSNIVFIFGTIKDNWQDYWLDLHKSGGQKENTDLNL